jgi:C-terminal processing protease CtpA/Prc
VTSADVSAFSDSLLHLVGSLDAQHACGWIVDLRGNLGGNMWPMLLGVEPILGDGEVGAFVDPDSVRSTWFSSPGSVGTRDANGDTTYVHTSDIPPVRLTQAMPPVAVLTDSLTASSGEAIAVAFRGRPGARSFGSPTFGVPTANHGYTLSDGALLLLTVAADADRTGRVYTDQLVPDEPIPPGTGPFAYDTVSVAAQAWLAAQPVCTSH